ncbi:MAG TPA: hypothetical protein VG939_10720 [Caulobacteraceae bacterium]|nr:hypothetical protein [Caulobacteraceae bacterium]
MPDQKTLVIVISLAVAALVLGKVLLLRWLMNLGRSGRRGSPNEPAVGEAPARGAGEAAGG